jgi:single-strand DNA-binding protein
MAKGYEIEGTIHLINDIQTFDSGFSKREFVIEVEDGKFPQMVKFEAVKEKTSLTDGLSKGDTVKVAFDIRGNEYNGRYFVNLNAWRLEKVGGESAGNSAPPAYSDDDAPPSHLSEPPPGLDAEQEDDIPF